MDLSKLKQSIMEHEGLRLFPYTDTTGHISIGYGTNLSAGISHDEAEDLLSNRLQFATVSAESQSWWAYLGGNDARQRAVVECVYNMGLHGFGGFHDTLAALERGDWPAASAGLLNSLWAHQVGQRAEVIAKMILTGED